MKRNKYYRLAWETTCLLIGITFFSGCMIGPDYARPSVPINAEYLETKSNPAALTGESAALAYWWNQFQDPVLSRLVQAALNDNLSIQQYAARIYQYQAQIGVVRADLFPHFTENGLYDYNKGLNMETQTWGLGTNMSWELDFFGRLKRLTEASVADMQQQNELYRDAQIIVIAEIARNYTNARLYQQQIEIAKRNIDIQKETYRIARDKETVGKNSKLDSLQSLGSYKGVESDLAQYEALYQKTLNYLSTLTGHTPGSIDELFRESAPIPAAPETLLTGIPAELLRNRPDIRAAEQALIAQTSRIGAAIGDLYPQFSLTGSFGIDAQDIASGFSSGIVSGFGPSFKWNIFAFGKYKSNVQVQEYRQQEYCLAYKDTVLNAAREVDDALVGYVSEKERLAKIQEAVKAYDEALVIAQKQHTIGTADFQRVLDSQSNKLKYELMQVQSQANLTNYVIDLYKALGGGTVDANYSQNAGNNSIVAP